MTELCESCKRPRQNTTTAVVGGVYYGHICENCLTGNVESMSSNAAGFDRRRQYEDYAQDTVQPYDAVGPSKEFYRLYPEAAAKVFSKEQIEQLRKQI